jgi:wyosine [tRNA(Phe)-imidazoG37] synthetase (radical SAM superfamily)
MLHLPQVQEALSIIDQPILKLDSAIQQEFEIINRPMYKINIQTIIENYANLSVPNKIIQTLLLRGKYNETKIDNTSEESLNALVSAINKINPKIWMLYVIDRPTPANNLEKLTFAELEVIKTKLQDKVNCEIKIYA